MNSQLPSPLRQWPAAVDSFFHLPSGSVSGRACCGTACFVARHRNSRRWQNAVAGGPRVYCLGQCFASPAVAPPTGKSVRPRVEVRARQGVVLGRLAAGGARTLDEYSALGGYQALDKALKHPAEQVLQAVETSGLRGRGGAAFPTGRKWRALAAEPIAEKHVIANADEGDPGAYIDRFLMEDDPFSLIEGMTLAAYATGAKSGWIYLRGEYPTAAIVLRAAIDEARTAGLLGPAVLGHADFGFDITLHVGRGSYVCGEETALIHALEGKRPEVRARPPLPTTQGLHGQPTVVNNVETLVSVPHIVAGGGEAYRELGFSSSRGTKAVSLNSLFARPGLYEVEFGVPVRHLVEELGGGLQDGDLKGVLIGGPLAGVIPPHLLDTLFGFEELRAIGAAVGHGGIVAFDQETSIAALVHHVFSFGAHESCGKCTPCRLGSSRIEEIFRLALEGEKTTREDHAAWLEFLSALKWASLCGHGTGLAEFGESVVRHYGKELASCFK